jgi:hypothetical protein
MATGLGIGVGVAKAGGVGEGDCMDSRASEGITSRATLKGVPSPLLTMTPSLSTETIITADPAGNFINPICLPSAMMGAWISASRVVSFVVGAASILVESPEISPTNPTIARVLKKFIGEWVS